MKRKIFYMLIILIKKNLFALFSRNVYFLKIPMPHPSPPHPHRGLFCFFKTENYRGITLLYALGKLFTSILNDRLYDCMTKKGINVTIPLVRYACKRHASK